MAEYLGRGRAQSEPFRFAFQVCHLIDDAEAMLVIGTP